jgi:hypothetical protein
LLLLLLLLLSFVLLMMSSHSNSQCLLFLLLLLLLLLLLTDQCTPGYYASAVEARPKAGFNWAGCAGERVGLAAFGERCGAAHDKFM